MIFQFCRLILLIVAQRARFDVAMSQDAALVGPRSSASHHSGCTCIVPK